MKTQAEMDEPMRTRSRVTKVAKPAAAVVPVQAEPAPMLALIARLATDPTVDVDKLSRLLDMQERLQKRQAEAEFAEAFVRLQPKLPRIKKDGTIELPDRRAGTVKTVKFASWPEIDAVCKPLYTAEGFGLTFDIGETTNNGGTSVTAILLHRNGHTRQTTAQGPLDTGPGRNNLQAYGSTLSYLQRYAGTRVLNITTEGEDDDGKLGGRVPITREHAAEIDKLRRELNVPIESLLALFEVEGVMDLADHDFVPAMNLLKARQRRAEKTDDANPS